MNGLLYGAAERGNLELVGRVIAEGADINYQKEPDLYTPLHIASLQGDYHIITILISHGADPQIGDKHGQTPLHLAAKKGHKEAISLLIMEGADPRVKDKYGQTPLHFAAKEGHMEVISLLIEKGADPEVKDKYGNTPIYLAKTQKSSLSF